MVLDKKLEKEPLGRVVEPYLDRGILSAGDRSECIATEAGAQLELYRQTSFGAIDQFIQLADRYLERSRELEVLILFGHMNRAPAGALADKPADKPASPEGGVVMKAAAIGHREIRWGAVEEAIRSANGCMDASEKLLKRILY